MDKGDREMYISGPHKLHHLHLEKYLPFSLVGSKRVIVLLSKVQLSVYLIPGAKLIAFFDLKIAENNFTRKLIK